VCVCGVNVRRAHCAHVIMPTDGKTDIVRYVCVCVCMCVIGSDEISVINLKSLLFTARAGRTRPAGPPHAVGNANPLRQNGRRRSRV